MNVAIVCGELADERFPGRNVFPLLGRPLMVYPLLAARHASEVSLTVLTTDDPSMAEIARRQGAEVVERPPELTGPQVALERVVVHALEQVRASHEDRIEAVVILLANAPTVSADLIDQGIAKLRSDPRLDAVITVSPHAEFSPAYALRLDHGGCLRPFSEALQDVHADGVYFPDFLMCVTSAEKAARLADSSIRPGWLVNAGREQVAPIVREGYGDVDYPWQIPLVEEWLRRRGFSEDRTPYDGQQAKTIVAVRAAPTSKITPAERRILITTVPFGQANPHPLELLGLAQAEFVINPIGRRLKEQELRDLIPDYGVLIAGTEPITAAVMDAAPHLRLIARVGIGLDNVALTRARENGIQVTYTPDAPSPAVAELTIGLMLTLLRGIAGADRKLRSGIWHRTLGFRLSERTIGVIGVGRVGRRVIRHLRGGFPGAKILANDLVPDEAFGLMHDVRWVEKTEIYHEADVITLHLPLTPLTHRLITSKEIALMQENVVLINTSRGNMIDEHDLAAALRDQRIAGAAVDVYEREPYSGELATLERMVLTCHMGSMSQDCRYRMELEAVEEVIRYLRGEPLQRVVPESEYLASEMTS